MNLYLLHQNHNRGYDTFDSMVVAAINEDVARNTEPPFGGVNCWCLPDHVRVTLIGTALESTEPGIVLASFNAG